ncbi:uncharacterized protein LOC123547577 isoform X2 [Mercenaria mercenaria]|nr:uncharacterized protein LOC123547577 isoform X2 [Mercenaria mercenaria]
MAENELTIKSPFNSDTEDGSIAEMEAEGIREVQPLSLQQTVNIQESELNPTVVSYVATTAIASGLPTDTSLRSRNDPRRLVNEKTTLLQDKLKEEFGDKVTCTLDDKILTLMQCKDLEGINNVDDFFKAINALLKAFEREVTVLLLEMDVERIKLAIKHFDSVQCQRPFIKLYKASKEFSLGIVTQTEGDKSLVLLHTNIVKQRVVELEKLLSMEDNFKIKACKHIVESQTARVSIQNRKMTICGFQEDVLATDATINKILCTHFCDSIELEDSVVELMKDTNVLKEVKENLEKLYFNVWCQVFRKSVYVVCANEKHVKPSLQRIQTCFSTSVVKLADYMVDSPVWEKMKSRVNIEYPGRVYIDDTTRRPSVIVQSTVSVCSKVTDMLDKFKERYTLIKRKIKLTESKLELILQHLSNDIEKANEEEFVKLKHDSDEATLDIDGTERGVSRVQERLEDVVTVKLWIADETFADWLKQMSLRKDGKWNKVVNVYENQVDIIFKTGRIEKEQVDVIVNSASQDLRLGVGQSTVTQAIRTAAGDRAQKCLDRHNKPVPFGSVIPGDPGNLKCKKIFHVVLQQFCETAENMHRPHLETVVKDCLDKASSGGYTSIAFPALCTGVHKYPLPFVAATMLDCMVAYINETEKTTLKQIFIVFLDADIHKRRIFEEHKNQRKEELVTMKQQRIFWFKVPWPCRYQCCITAATRASACDFTEEVNGELLEQTFAKT